MPDLLGLPSVKASRRLSKLGLGSQTWGPDVAVGCEVRPHTVVQQRPAAGMPVRPNQDVRIRTAGLDLERFRGPCRGHEVAIGPITEPDLRLARRFYRFAADPSLAGGFAPGDVWVGIEDGQGSMNLAAADLDQLTAWEFDVLYAERSGPLSPLDVVARSGGYYQLRRGIVGTCPSGNDLAPEGLSGFRTLSLTSPRDVTSSCIDWWGVTLFVDSRDRIRGVALRLGSP